MTRILVVGAGATGGYFGARLAQASRDVTFLVRPARAAELHSEGLRISTGGRADEVERLLPKLVTAADLTGPYDLVLLTVKGGALDAALRDMAPAVGSDTAIVPFLNGVGHLAAIGTRFPHAVLGGVVKVEAQLAPDGTVTVAAPAASMEIGELDGADTPRLRAAAEALGSAGFDLRVSDDIRTAMWHKWVFISAATVITCLAQGTVGDVAGVPGGPDFAAAVLAEAAAVSAAAGHPLPADAYAGLLATLSRQGSHFVPSMYRDVTQGRPTEVDQVLVSLAAEGRHHGLSTALLDAAVVRLRVHDRHLAADRDQR
ncbi:ketopantoate reductase family protein [Streptomyces sp. MMS24-I2-30]|uniref:ketopantoate reductase family protein n=1 Tax=Streptomyces sp. MMS24-I2-30 TaxID=3351564 RepID=UPI003896CCB8